MKDGMSFIINHAENLHETNVDLAYNYYKSEN